MILEVYGREIPGDIDEVGSRIFEIFLAPRRITFEFVRLEVSSIRLLAFDVFKLLATENLTFERLFPESLMF